jgi:hypothetical protein
MAFHKYFNCDTPINDIDVGDWESVVDAVEKRFVVWWFEPFSQYPKTGHEAFPVLLSMCRVLDEFCVLTGVDIPEFLRNLDSSFEMKFDFVEFDAAEVFYNCVCLGGYQIGDPAGMSGTGELVSSAGETVVFDPWVLRDTLLEWLRSYCSELRESPVSEDSVQLKKYLKSDFGLDVK